MRIPTITGLIKRRILLNYRVDPEVAANLLPAPFHPKLVHGHAIAGICLIRLENIRPKGLPEFAGLASENSAHRIAVEWEDENGQTREGVFVPRRDTDSQLNAVAGGRIFSGVQHLSRFTVSDEAGAISIRVDPREDDSPVLDLKVRESRSFPEDSVFGSLDESSRFFENGCVGYSSRPDSCRLDGLLLKVDNWQVSALEIDHARSAYFDDPALFPTGSIELDHALLMRDIPHEWHSEPEMTSKEAPG